MHHKLEMFLKDAMEEMRQKEAVEEEEEEGEGEKEEGVT